MKVTIPKALQNAIGAHKAGQIQEADSLYTATLNEYDNVDNLIFQKQKWSSN